MKKLLVILFAGLVAIGVSAEWKHDKDPNNKQMRGVRTTHIYTNLITSAEDISITNSSIRSFEITYVDFISTNAPADFTCTITKPSGRGVVIVEEAAVDSFVTILDPAMPLDGGEILTLSTTSTDAEIKVRIKLN